MTGREAALLGTLVLVVVSGSETARAQGTPYTRSSPLRPCCGVAGTESAPPLRDTVPSLLSVSRNAAAIPQVLGTAWHRLSAQARSTRGDWRRPQEAAQSEQIALVAEGLQRAGQWTVAGGAEYLRATDAGVAWRKTSDAYLGNTYIWADSVGGTFRRDELGLAGAIASPIWHGITAAVQLDYGIGQGARRNDPKPLFRRRVAELAPAVTYAIGRHVVGAGVMIGWQREDLEIGGGASAEFPVVFRLRGLGTFDRTQLISAERAMIGGVTGGHAGWSRTGDRWQMAVGGTVRIERDSVRDGIATPVSGGAMRRVRSDGQAALRYRTDRGGAEVSAALRTEEARGFDPVFRAVNVIEDGTTLQTRLRWWRGPDPVAARWAVTINHSRAQLLRRDLAAETEWNATTPSISGVVARRLPAPAGNMVIGLGAGAGWRAHAEYAVGRPTRLTSILAMGDFAVVAAPQRQALATIAWERRWVGGTSSRLRLDGVVARTVGVLADSRESLTRTHLSLSLELY